VASPQHVDTAKHGTAAIAAWRLRNPSMSLDLSGVDLQNVNLAGADLSGATFTYANLAGARLNAANFRVAKCNGATFDSADLSNADFTGADVGGATFTNATLTGVKGLPQAVVDSARGVGRATISANNALVTVLIAALALVAFYFIFRQLQETQIRDVDYARGLITVVFTIGSMAIAFIIVTARWWTNADDANNRFTQAKEIFTLLVGILGTVVGWYFGQQAAARTSVRSSIADVQFVPREAAPGDKVTVTGRIVGGVPPYHVEIEPIGSDAFEAVKDASSPPMFKETLSIRPAASPTVDVAVRIGARDANQVDAVEYASPKNGGIIVCQPVAATAVH
jgi:hypothetical protein